MCKLSVKLHIKSEKKKKKRKKEKNVFFSSCFAFKFLEFLKIRMDSCSCVIVVFLSTTEEPRQKESRGGDGFTRQENSQQHLRKSLMVVLQTKTLPIAPSETSKRKKRRTNTCLFPVFENGKVKTKTIFKRKIC